MKCRKLEDYQLKCFQKKFKTRCKDIILCVDDDYKKAFYIKNNLTKFNINYNYAVMYF